VTSDPLWYQHAVIYQAHVRAFFDSNGDGIGDFAGLTEKLDYIQSLGVSALWILPFYPSPLRDDGYDIALYEGVHQSYGTPEDFGRFLDAAHARGLKVITELVINHTSAEHPWFQAARRAPKGSPERDFYVWSDTDQKYPGVRIIFSDTERSNWTWDPVAGQYYWHRFFHHQPDLNFDHPPVREAVLKVMRYWLDQGVDGLRLDAVPYLIERDGTSCANLPETHQILRDLRRELDAHYENRMLLAEANLWPSDVITYFGDGDECHMAFHFPLMPRLYMALRQEDRHPISEILYQTPEIPPTCQWAIFLRNHDELTLEMVTDEERDYMYQAYAADPIMRVNAGIRRRLAPMMENSRAKIELMHGLLLSLPGTPVVYYGDEIGMGDNVYLGDRNGVRTPMQWTTDRNGGFSRADPARLYAPPIMDPVYGFPAVNVEAQDRSPHSLLNWMRRQIALRQRHRAFGRGTVELLRPENRRVFAFIRQFESDDPILIVANLSRTVQPCTLDLSRFEGLVPCEMSGGTPLPKIGNTPYFLTIGPHSFYWLALQRPDAATVEAPVADRTEGAARLPILLGPDWSAALNGRTRAHLERHHLPAYVGRQTWFEPAGDAPIRMHDWTLLDPGAASPSGFAILGAGAVRYTTPLVMVESATPPPDIGHADLIAGIGGDRDGWLHGALDATVTRALARLVRTSGELRLHHGVLRGVATAAMDPAGLAEDLPVHPLTAPPRGTNSVAFLGERAVLKLYRRVWPGPSTALGPGAHPEFEALQFLTERAHFPRVPAAWGRIDYVPDVDPGGTLTVALVESFAPHQVNGWQQAFGELERFFHNAVAWRDVDAALPAAVDLWNTDIPATARQTVGAYLENAMTLGRRVAELHLALAPLRRIHGSLRLGDALLRDADYWIVDFEGAPGRAFAERGLGDHPFTDLASLVRSIRETAALALSARAALGPRDAERMPAWATWWATWVSAAVVAAYRDTADGASWIPREAAGDQLARLI
jgi:maltose alpha-D-glucosyltransferase/alpha-amylase